MGYYSSKPKPPSEAAIRARHLQQVQERWAAAGFTPVDYSRTASVAPETVPARLLSPPTAASPAAAQETAASTHSRPIARPVQAEPLPATEPAEVAAARGLRLVPKVRDYALPREHPRATPPVMRRAIIAAYLEGETPPQIALRSGITPTTVRRILRDARIEMRDDRAGHSGGNNRIDAYPPELVQQVRDRYTAGWSQPQIGSWLRRSTKFVQDVMAKHGIPIRSQSEAQSLRPRDDAGVWLPQTVPVREDLL